MTYESLKTMCLVPGKSLNRTSVRSFFGFGFEICKNSAKSLYSTQEYTLRSTQIEDWRIEASQRAIEG